jgi:hypothetical protein
LIFSARGMQSESPANGRFPCLGAAAAKLRTVSQ